MLKDIISIASGFQAAVNIEYDFNDESKISGFIPTSSALSVIDSILENTENNRTERAKILTGAYGRGKSHIVLVALAVLYNKDANKFKKLIKRIKKLDVESAQRVENFISSKKRLLPVIINETAGICPILSFKHCSRLFIIMKLKISCLRRIFLPHMRRYKDGRTIIRKHLISLLS